MLSHAMFMYKMLCCTTYRQPGPQDHTTQHLQNFKVKVHPACAVQYVLSQGLSFPEDYSRHSKIASRGPSLRVSQAAGPNELRLATSCYVYSMVPNRNIQARYIADEVWKGGHIKYCCIR